MANCWPDTAYIDEHRSRQCNMQQPGMQIAYVWQYIRSVHCHNVLTRNELLVQLVMP